MTDPYDAFNDMMDEGATVDDALDTFQEHFYDDDAESIYEPQDESTSGGCLVLVFALGLIPLIAKLVLA